MPEAAPVCPALAVAPSPALAVPGKKLFFPRNGESARGRHGDCGTASSSSSENDPAPHHYPPTQAPPPPDPLSSKEQTSPSKSTATPPGSPTSRSDKSDLLLTDEEIEHFPLFSRPRSVLTLFVALALLFALAVRHEADSSVARALSSSEVSSTTGEATLSAQQGAPGAAGAPISRAPGAPPAQLSGNLFRGYLAAAGILLVTAACSFPDGPFTKPHPLCWRVVLGLLLSYWLTLVFVLFLDYTQVRDVLAFLDPELTPEKRLPEQLPWKKLRWDCHCEGDCVSESCCYCNVPYMIYSGIHDESCWCHNSCALSGRGPATAHSSRSCMVICCIMVHPIFSWTTSARIALGFSFPGNRGDYILSPTVSWTARITLGTAVFPDLLMFTLPL